MSEHKRNRNAKAYWLALILCVCAVWITGYVFFRSENQVQVPASPMIRRWLVDK